jgi:phosphocarrier protein
VAAGSVLNLMTLGAAFGDEVVITAEGEGAQAAVDAIAELVATDHDA